MKKSDLTYTYPEELVALNPSHPSRVLLVDDSKNADLQLKEISMEDVKNLFLAGDVLVINDTKVEARRVIAKNIAQEPVEVLFVKEVEPNIWQVLAPTRLFKGKPIQLPQEITAEIIQSGRPQLLRVSSPLTADYFQSHGQVPLPPYIQKARQAETGDRSIKSQDKTWYQTEWAKVTGSSAAPTASLHFTNHDLAQIKSKGVNVCPVTLHVGLGTYLPLTVEDLNDHEMHRESVVISRETMRVVADAKKNKKRVWALGTTAARAIEAWAQNHFTENSDGVSGETDLLIQEGFEWKVIDGLLTNFHQPESTLLALVCGFVGRSRVFEAYEFAIKNRFRLFSYGDLSVWLRGPHE